MAEALQERIFRDFVVEKELKRGERSTVCLVRGKTDGQRRIYRRFTGDAAVYEKLICLTFPHLPTVEAAEQDGDVVHVLEEFIQGDTLAFLLRYGPFSEEQAVSIARQLCRALAKLHSLGIIHRDIKPENVILRGDEAVLIDFDASRLRKDERSSDTRIMGTAGYAAPEQYGFNQTDARADIYAVGVLLNEMLTGQHPAKELAQGECLSIIEKCIEVNVDRRYRDTGELLSALQDLPQESYGGKKRRKRPLVLGILAGFILLLGVLFLLSARENTGRSITLQSNDTSISDEISDKQPTETPLVEKESEEKELIPLQEGQWPGLFGDDGQPIADPCYFRYDLDGDGEEESYVFGTSLHNGGLEAVLVIGDEVDLSGAQGTYRNPVPSVWRVEENGQITLMPEFAPLLMDVEIRVWRGTNLTAPEPPVTAYESPWPGGIHVEYTREHVGVWVYETIARLGEQTLRSVSKTILVIQT